MRSTLERYERIAPLYDLLDLPFEYGRYRTSARSSFTGCRGGSSMQGSEPGRAWLITRAGSHVVGVDLSPAMLARADRRARQSRGKAELHQMDVTRLTIPDRSFNAAVASFLFCVLPNDLPVPALREIGHVLRPGGTLRLLKYVRPKGPYRPFVARLWEPWMAWAYGAGFDRRTEEDVAEMSFDVVDSRFVVPDLIKKITLRAPSGE